MTEPSNRKVALKIEKNKDQWIKTMYFWRKLGSLFLWWVKWLNGSTVLFRLIRDKAQTEKHQLATLNKEAHAKVRQGIGCFGLSSLSVRRNRSVTVTELLKYQHSSGMYSRFSFLHSPRKQILCLPLIKKLDRKWLGTSALPLGILLCWAFIFQGHPFHQQFVNDYVWKPADKPWPTRSSAARRPRARMASRSSTRRRRKKTRRSSWFNGALRETVPRRLSVH